MAVTEITKQKIEELNLPGIEFEENYKRYYPNGNFLSYTLGYAKSNDDGDYIGEMGVELYYNEELTGEKIIVNKNSHLMGALGVAILSKENNEIDFSFDIEDISFETRGFECMGCANNCEIIKVMRNKEVIDSWGNRCPKGELVHK